MSILSTSNPQDNIYLFLWSRAIRYTNTLELILVSFSSMYLKNICLLFQSFIFFVGDLPEDGVPDMTRLTVLDEEVINKNLKRRYEKDKIYVSFYDKKIVYLIYLS